MKGVQQWVWTMLYYAATTCTSTENKINTCTMILNIIYLLKNPLIGCGNLSGGRVYEALFPKFDGVYKIFLLHTSLGKQGWYRIPGSWRSTHSQMLICLAAQSLDLPQMHQFSWGSRMLCIWLLQMCTARSLCSSYILWKLTNDTAFGGYGYMVPQAHGVDIALYQGSFLN